MYVCMYDVCIVKKQYSCNFQRVSNLLKIKQQYHENIPQSDVTLSLALFYASCLSSTLKKADSTLGPKRARRASSWIDEQNFYCSLTVVIKVIVEQNVLFLSILSCSYFVGCCSLVDLALTRLYHDKSVFLVLSFATKLDGLI